MKRTVLREGPVRSLLRQFVFAELYTDRQTVAADEQNRRLQKERFGSIALPLYVTVGPDGAERSRLEGQVPAETFIEFLKKGLDGKTGSK